MKQQYHDLYKNEAYLNAVSNSKGNAQSLNLTLIGFYTVFIKVIGFWTAFKVLSCFS